MSTNVCQTGYSFPFLFPPRNEGRKKGEISNKTGSFVDQKLQWVVLGKSGNI